MIKTYIGLGSNLGDSLQILTEAVHKLATLGPLQVSQLYQSPPMGPQDQPNYLNAAVQLQTDLVPLALLDELQRFEQESGRVRLRHWGERTLDLDLLLYDDIVCQIPVVLPRAEIVNNAFVLWPLAELAPNLVHPLVHQTYAKLWDDYDKDSQRLWPVTFEWPCGLTF